MNKQKKVVLSLSGGMDSTTLLSYLLDGGHEVQCVNFYYGSKHNDYELEAIEKIKAHYNVEVTSINLSFIGELFNSNLLKDGGEVPKGHYEDSNMSKTVVPGRNSIFTSVLTGFAESIGYDTVALGQHLGDHQIYDDCRKEFVMAMSTAMYLASGKKVEIVAPFIDIDKSDICKIGLELKVPYELTHTCYDPNGEGSCGKCGACVERISSFMKYKAVDPIKYRIDINWNQDYVKYLESQKN